MNHRVLSVLFAIFVVVLAIDWAYSGDEWQDLSASEKHKQLWAAVKEDPKPYGWYGALTMLEMFAESMDTTFDHTGDEFPRQGPFSLFTRKKLIHSVGAVAQIEWSSVGSHPYTGLFRGNRYTFLRLSLAKPPTKDSFPVGVALKMLRTKRPSANFVAMYSLPGQNDSTNVFRHDLTNHVPNINPAIMSFAETQLFKAFRKASDWPTMVGLLDVASYQEDGTPEKNPVFPYRLVLHPVKRVRTLFSDNEPVDTWLDTVQTTPVGTLYDVYAQSSPTSKLQQIAKIVLKSRFVSSTFGDSGLFFQHKRFEDDLAVHPEWAAGAQAILDHEASIEKFVNPDLED